MTINPTKEHILHRFVHCALVLQLFRRLFGNRNRNTVTFDLDSEGTEVQTGARAEGGVDHRA